MKQRIITAIGIILVVALPVALGGYWLEALALFIVCAGAYEWMHIQPDFKSLAKICNAIKCIGCHTNKSLT